MNVGSGTYFIKDDLTKPVHSIEICAHALHHDFGCDVDHVRMTHVTPIHYVGHVHAAAEFVGLNLHGEDADLGGLHVSEHFGRHAIERAGCNPLQNERIPGAADLV